MHNLNFNRVHVAQYSQPILISKNGLAVLFLLSIVLIYNSYPNSFLYTQKITLLIETLPILTWIYLSLRANQKRCLNFFDPLNAALYAFLIFHIIFNNTIFYHEYLLFQRKIDTISTGLLYQFYNQYNFILLFAFAFYKLGATVKLNFAARFFDNMFFNLKITGSTIQTTALLFIFTGIFGNILLIDGFGNYLEKMVQFYAISDTYVGTVEVLGGGLIIKKILQSFFIPGVLLIFWLRLSNNKISNTINFIVLVFFVFLLNGTTGQRSALLNPIIFIFVSYLAYGGKVSVLRLVLVAVSIFTLAIALGFARDQDGANTAIDFGILMNNFATIAANFAAQYLTNFSGAITLMDVVHNTGYFQQDTIFSGFKGLLGGATPITTEAYVWDYLTGSLYGSNPRYGLFIELYANYGYLGIPLIFFSGVIVKLLSILFNDSIRFSSAPSKIVIAYIFQMAVLVVNGNASYFGQQIFYLSFPYYLAFLLRKSHIRGSPT